ncbi:MAG: metallophosphoesterase family protein [SAR324 cluster bacterium]|nr:metallophosphoesterase family protein [SAR324 cluster bacterium]
MKLIWLTDIHLDFLSQSGVEAFLEKVARLQAQSILISGDIGTARNIVSFLRLFEQTLQCPIYFVLGNHDYYQSSIKIVRERVRKLVDESCFLRYLTLGGIVTLTPGTGLIGHDSWADGRFGNFMKSEVLMNDYILIDELARRDPDERNLQMEESEFLPFHPTIPPAWDNIQDIMKEHRIQLLHQYGKEAADFFKELLPQALARFEHVLLLTHVPPFQEACWHEGNFSNDIFLPHFACKTVGDVLLEIMHDHPNRRLTVLCGHTHSRGEAHILPNLCVKTGAGVYHDPQIEIPIFIR